MAANGVTPSFDMQYPSEINKLESSSTRNNQANVSVFQIIQMLLLLGGKDQELRDVPFLLYARHCGRCVMIYEQHMY